MGIWLSKPWLTSWLTFGKVSHGRNRWLSKTWLTYLNLVAHSHVSRSIAVHHLVWKFHNLPHFPRLRYRHHVVRTHRSVKALLTYTFPNDGLARFICFCFAWHWKTIVVLWVVRVMAGAAARRALRVTLTADTDNGIPRGKQRAE